MWRIERGRGSTTSRATRAVSSVGSGRRRRVGRICVGRQRQAAFAGNGRLVFCWNEIANQVSVEPGDEAAMGVVHGVVPAVVGRDWRRLVVPGLAVDDFFAGVAG